jgi:hypothetical protein
MALRVKGQVKQVIGSTAFSLQADPGESFLVRNIRIYNPSTSYLTVKIDQYTAGYFRVGGTMGSHLPFCRRHSQHSHNITTGSGSAGDQTSFADWANAGGTTQLTKAIGGAAASTTYHKMVSQETAPWAGGMTILEMLAEANLFVGYPVATGQRFTLSGAAQSGCITEVLYDIYDEGEIKATDPNGSQANEMLFLSYANTGAAINATGDNLYDTLVNPTDFPAFPWTDDAPSGRRTEVHALLGSTFAPKENDGTHYTNQTYMKIVRDQTVLFDEDRNGLLFYDDTATTRGNKDRVGEGWSQIGGYSDVDNAPPYIFNPPLVFDPGEDLKIYLTTAKTGNGQNIATDEQEIALVIRMVKA